MYQKYLTEVMDLRGLQEHPGWITLKEHFERGAENFERSLTRRLMQGEKVSQSEIDFHRGATAVAKEIFTHPETAVKQLDAAAQRLFLLQEGSAAEREPSLYTDD